MTTHRETQRKPHLLKLALAPDKRGKAAPRGDIEMAVRCPGSNDLVNVDRSGDSFNFGRPQAAQVEIAFDQTPRLFTDYDPVRRRCALHARRQIDHVTHR